MEDYQDNSNHITNDEQGEIAKMEVDDESEKKPTSGYENDRIAFESRIRKLERKNRAVIAFVIAFLLIFLLGTFSMATLHVLNIEQSQQQISQLQRLQTEIQVRIVMSYMMS